MVPNIELFGSYFPGWLVACAGGVLLSILTYELLRAFRLQAFMKPGILVYPSIVWLWSLALWLIFFNI